MPPRPEDAAAFGGPAEVHVRLVDLEPVMGLVAAIARFCAALTPAVYEALAQSEQAVGALSDVQALLWRMEHSGPETPQQPPQQEG
jgi:hypothetical protein